MAREDLLLAPESLEALLLGLDDVKKALGGDAAAVAGLERVRQSLQGAVAARADGRTEQAVQSVLTALQELAALAGSLGPAEAAAMQAVASNFQSALRRGDAGHAADSVNSMRKQSGAVKKRGDEFKL